MERVRTAIDCTLVAINVIFFIGGCAITALGGVMVSSEEWQEVYGTGMEKYALSVLGSGVFIVLVSLIGSIGVKKRSRTLLLTYVSVLVALFIAQIVVGYFLYERFWGDLRVECVQKGTSYHTVWSAANRPSMTSVDNLVTPNATTIDCSNFIENKLRLTAYVLWQKLYRDYELYKSNPSKYANYRTNARIAMQLAAKAKCCGFGAPVATDSADATKSFPCKENLKEYNFAGYSIKYQRCSNKENGRYCSWRLAAGSTELKPYCKTEHQVYDMPIGCGASVDGLVPCYEYGCADAAYAFLRKHVYVIGMLLGLLIVAEMFGIIAVCLVLNPCVIAALLCNNVLLGVDHFIAGMHKFVKCCRHNTVAKCSKNEGDDDEIDVEAGDSQDDDDGSCCGWICDCIWCCCCCWICLGVCKDVREEDKKKQEENEQEENKAEDNDEGEPEQKPLTEAGQRSGTKIAV